MQEDHGGAWDEGYSHPPQTLLMFSVCLAGPKGRGGAEAGCVGGAGRKGWAGRVLLPSLKGYRRKSGLRQKAEREDAMARAKYLI